MKPPLGPPLLRSTSALVALTFLVLACTAPTPPTSNPEPAGPAPAVQPAAALRVPDQRFGDPTLEHLGTALGAYEDTRAALTNDDLEATSMPAARLAASLRLALSSAVSLPEPTPRVLEEAARAAESTAAATELALAREAFGEISRFLLPVAVADERLADGWSVFSCPMAKGFDKWMQPSGELGNPYMGQAMPSCGESTDWSVPAPRDLEELLAHAEHAHGDSDVAYYTCSMHPSVQSEEPGTCPICSMNLVPVTRQEIDTGVVFVDDEQRQTIGVTTTEVVRRPVTVRLRAVGQVTYDERRLADVTVKVAGWIAELRVNETGQYVKQGQTLFTFYSPELYAAQEELLAAVASQHRARETSAPDRSDDMVRAARNRLRLWGLEDRQIDRIAAATQSIENLPIVSPVSGWVVEKNVVEGAGVQPGTQLFRIGGLDRIWIEAQVYEQELSLIEVGQEATVEVSYLPGKRLVGRVGFVYPYLDRENRTGRVRIELDNLGLELKPDMYAEVYLDRDLGDQLVVPDDAVLYAGERRFVFVDLGEGRFQPRRIEAGVDLGDDLVVRSGLEEGEVVVTSGSFLIAAEARLKVALEQWQ